MITIILRNYPSVLQSGCTILESHQQCMKIQISPHFHLHLLLSAFEKINILIQMGMEYLMVFFNWGETHIIENQTL